MKRRFSKAPDTDQDGDILVSLRPAMSVPPQRQITNYREVDTMTKSLLVELFARGYTVSYIRKHLARELNVVVTDQVLLQAAVDLDADTMEYRNQIAERVYAAGLARKEERVRRLSEVAEAFEPAAKEGSSKAAETFMKAIKQVQEEMEPLGIDVKVTTGDPWFLLLQQVRTAQNTNPQLSPGSALVIDQDQPPPPSQSG